MEITEELLQSRSGNYDPELIFELDLSSLNLVSLIGLERCNQLVKLNVSHNKVSVLCANVLNKSLYERDDNLRKRTAFCFIPFFFRSFRSVAWII